MSRPNDLAAEANVLELVKFLREGISKAGDDDRIIGARVGTMKQLADLLEASVAVSIEASVCLGCRGTGWKTTPEEKKPCAVCAGTGRAASTALLGYYKAALAILLPRIP